MTSVVDYERGGADEFQQEGIPGHNGEPRPKPADFFAPPPPELGQILSAESTLPAGKREIPLWLRLAIAGVIAAVVWGGVAWAMGILPQWRELAPTIAVLAALIVGGLVLYFIRFSHTCTYVGRNGAARFRLRGSRSKAAKEYTLLFSQAAELRASQVRQHYNGVYVGTNYDYRWTDPAGRLLYRLNGSYRARKKKRPKPTSGYNFALASELAWSSHYLARAQAQLEAEGSIPFRIDNRRVVRVGQGFLEFHFGDQPERVTREDIASVSLGNGQFSFKHKDARWFSRAGKYSFGYGRMANGRVFLLALEKLMGYRWS
jgi:hypothetical protein